MNDLTTLSIQTLLQRQAAVGDELWRRDVCRTSNNPLGDVAEHLFHKAFGWVLEPNSKAGFDAKCETLGKIQIKSRRVSARNKSLQAGDIRGLEMKLFDYLAGVVFDENYDLMFAMLIPHQKVMKNALKIEHTNSFRIYLRPDWLTQDGVSDLTSKLRSTWKELNAAK